MNRSFYKLQRARPESKIDPLSRAKKICDYRKPRALYAGEEQRRAFFFDDSPMDLGELEIRIDLGAHLDQLMLAPEEVDE